MIQHSHRPFACPCPSPACPCTSPACCLHTSPTLPAHPACCLRLLPAALELLVANRVTGLPVCDGEGKVVGVVSDFDLLALEGIVQKEKSEGLFPTAGSNWDSFFEVQKLIQKNEGKM